MQTFDNEGLKGLYRILMYWGVDIETIYVKATYHLFFLSLGFILIKDLNCINMIFKSNTKIC